MRRWWCRCSKSTDRREKSPISYHAPRYLIGPRIYPLYIMIIKIVLPILAVLMVVQFGFSVSRSSLDLTRDRAHPQQIGG